MSDWNPAGSVPYDTAYADGPYTTEANSVNGSVPYFSTIPYREPKVAEPRNPKNCISNDNTCKGFKANGTDHCVGHLASIAKASAS